MKVRLSLIYNNNIRLRTKTLKYGKLSIKTNEIILKIKAKLKIVGMAIFSQSSRNINQTKYGKFFI